MIIEIEVLWRAIPRVPPALAAVLRSASQFELVHFQFMNETPAVGLGHRRERGFPLARAQRLFRLAAQFGRLHWPLALRFHGPVLSLGLIQPLAQARLCRA